jgi:hypothetical protein
MIVSPARATHRQTYAVRIALTLLFLFLAGMTLVVGEGQFTPPVLIALAILAAVNIALWVLIGKTVLTIHDDGIRRVSITGTKEIEWRNVREYRYRAIPVQAGGLLGAAAIGIANRVGGRKATTNFQCEVIGEDGTKIKITSSYQKAYDAIGVLLAAVHDRLRPNVTKAIASTGAVFGPVRLTSRDVQWKSKDPVPLRELAYAELAGQTLTIKKEGKLFSVVSVRSDKVPNVLLLIEQMEALGVGGNRMKSIDPLAHVRT